MIQVFQVEQGALIEVPIHEHHNGRNWLAVIVSDPRQPGGLHREFIQRARGRFRYLVHDLPELAPVEFGADRVKARARKGNQKDARRWYGVVLAVASDHVTCWSCFNETEAMDTAERLLSDADERRQMLRDKVEAEADARIVTWLEEDLQAIDRPDVDWAAIRHRMADAREAIQRLDYGERLSLAAEFGWCESEFTITQIHPDVLVAARRLAAGSPLGVVDAQSIQVIAQELLKRLHTQDEHHDNDD